MANNIVSTAVFTPFTFDEMVKPLEMYRQYYNTNEKAINDLAEKTGKWENFISQENDPDLYNTTRSYTQDLMDKANILANEGMSPSLKREISSMRDRYNTDIKPIEDAYKKREALQTQQYKKMMTDDSVMFDKDYNSMSLSDIMKPENTGYKTVSGKNLMKEAKDLGAELSKRQVRAAVNNALDPNIENLNDMLGKYHMLGQYFGYDNQQAIEALSNIENNPEFQKIYNDLYNTRDINLLSSKDQERAKSYILTGLAQGLTYKQSLTPYSRSVGSSGRSSGGSGGRGGTSDYEKMRNRIWEKRGLDINIPEERELAKEQIQTDAASKTQQNQSKAQTDAAKAVITKNKSEEEAISFDNVISVTNGNWNNSITTQLASAAGKEPANYGIFLDKKSLEESSKKDKHIKALKLHLKNIYPNVNVEDISNASIEKLLEALNDSGYTGYIDGSTITFVSNPKRRSRKRNPFKSNTSLSSNLGQAISSSDITKAVNSASLGAFTNSLNTAGKKAPSLNVSTDFLNKE